MQFTFLCLEIRVRIIKLFFVVNNNAKNITRYDVLSRMPF